MVRCTGLRWPWALGALLVATTSAPVLAQLPGQPTGRLWRGAVPDSVKCAVACYAMRAIPNLKNELDRKVEPHLYFGGYTVGGPLRQWISRCPAKAPKPPHLGSLFTLDRSTAVAMVGDSISGTVIQAVLIVPEDEPRRPEKDP